MSDMPPTLQSRTLEQRVEALEADVSALKVAVSAALDAVRKKTVSQPEKSP